jgi:hypothetical protein
MSTRADAQPRENAAPSSAAPFPTSIQNAMERQAAEQHWQMPVVPNFSPFRQYDPADITQLFQG